MKDRKIADDQHPSLSSSEAAEVKLELDKGKQPLFPMQQREENSTTAPPSPKKNLSGAVPPPLHPREAERLALLANYEILDSGHDPILDRMTELTASILDVPIVLVAMVDKDRVWFKAAHGFSLKESERELSFCGHAILDTEKIFLVPDTLKDPRFATNPFVTGEPHIRFYAGVPLVDERNLPLGTFCVIDTKPRQLDEHQLGTLRKLSNICMGMIESHLANLKITRLLQLEKEVYTRIMQSGSNLALTALTFDDALNYLMIHLDPDLGWLSGRVRNMQTGGMTAIYYNPSLSKDEELPLLWNQIDNNASNSREIAIEGEFISYGPHRTEYSHLVMPVRIRSKMMATIELIFPDHHNLDPRIKEVFHIIAANLATIAERELTNVELQYQANHDPLTGAANRPVIMRAIEKALLETDPLSPDSALLFFDIDGFKEVNDNFGHEIGDQLLKEITRRLEGICRNQDMLGRLSGDEFVLVARGIDVEEGLPPLLERITRTLSQSFMLGDLEIKITASIGCAVFSNNDLTPNELLRRAEEAMYLVKNGERTEFCIADEVVVREFQIRRSLDYKVKDAFANDRFFMVYQPIVNLQSGMLSGVETLLRLKEKNGSVMQAGNFMKAIERTRYLSQVDERVFAETIRTFSSGLPKTLLAQEGFRISINISPAILSTKGYAKNCLNRLRQAGLSPRFITLEIVESSLLPANETVLNNLSLLRDEGVSIALDDFGTGYSNLQQLSRLPVDIIKIDKEFIGGIANGEPIRNGLLGAILGIGKNLGYDILAEGVETKLQADYLRSLGCHFGQGFFFGKPMPIDQLLNFLQSQFLLSEFPEVFTETESATPHQAVFIPQPPD